MSILRTEGIIKDYPGTRALDDVTVSFDSGKVHAFIGKNGSGKSTLVKVFAGAIQPTSGHFYLDDEELHFSTPVEALNKGIATVYQELSLVPHLSGGKYIFGTSSEEGTSGRLEEDVSDGRRAAACNGRRY